MDVAGLIPLLLIYPAGCKSVVPSKGDLTGQMGDKPHPFEGSPDTNLVMAQSASLFDLIALLAGCGEFGARETIE